MVTKEEKCEYCGCRGGSTICYYNCGCHNKQKDEMVLPKLIKFNILDMPSTTC